jgi:DNA-binding Lrp family transcriptional regulator
MTSRPNSQAVTNYLLSHVVLFPPNYLAKAAATKFGISTQAIHKRLKKLEAEGHLKAEGRTRGKRYFPVWKGRIAKTCQIVPGLAEDELWSNDFKPLLPEMSRNSTDMCYYGFTEMVNNAIDHSEGESFSIEIQWTLTIIRITVKDDGVGIFRKIQREKNLVDPRQAILELAKGKLTTDPERHTGQGIYFTSRLFDEFSILSGELFFKHSAPEEDWLTEYRVFDTGTWVDMLLMRETPRDFRKVIDGFSADTEDYSFSSTHVPVGLVAFGDERLVSRSQARRLLGRFDRFAEVMLDFKGVEGIGQAFTDEIFRVFRKGNPEVKFVILNTNAVVDGMIKSVMGDEYPELIK